MAGFHMSSQRSDITSEGHRTIVDEQLIDYSDNKRKRRSESPLSTTAGPFTDSHGRCCLHVGNLPYDVTKHDLHKLFSRYNISDARIPVRHRNDRTRGSGFVDMTSLRDAQNAISSLSGVMFLGREVNVMMARSMFSTAAVRDARDDEPPEKKIKRGSDWERDTKKSTFQGLKYEEPASCVSPPPRKPSTSSTGSPIIELLALEFAQMWVEEYAGTDVGRAKKTESLAGLLLQLDIPESKLHEHISRTLMARAASRKHDTAVPEDRSVRSESTAVKLENHKWKEIQGVLHARAHPSDGEGDAPTRSSRRRARRDSQKTRSFGSVAWTDGRV